MNKLEQIISGVLMCVQGHEALLMRLRGAFELEVWPFRTITCRPDVPWLETSQGW